MSAGLEVIGASVVKGGRAVVSEVRFGAPGGKVTGLVGPNGAGKSTLIGAVVGLERLAQGTVLFDGADLRAMDRRPRAKLCAYVEQSAATEERLSVVDVVALGRIPHGSVWVTGPSVEDAAIVMGALDRVGMAELAARQFNTLSGGEQQRVQMARALAQEPKLLVLDEPTSHLDIRAQLQVLDLLGDLAKAGGTVLLVLHDLNLALRYCDWLVVLDGGQVAGEGVPADILTADLLARVYGVRARVLEGGAGPVIAYEGIF